jgi:hypothetical protein
MKEKSRYRGPQRELEVGENLTGDYIERSSGASSPKVKQVERDVSLRYKGTAC